MTTANMALALLLAKMCVAEVSFTRDIRECELMWSINQINAAKNRITLKRQTLKYNTYFKVHNAKAQRFRAKRPWIQHLDGPERPKGWPSSMSWEVHRPLWRNIKLAAQRFVMGKRVKMHGCDDAIHYGAPGEIPSGKMEQIHCLNGEQQRYWRFRNRKRKGLQWKRKKKT